MEHVFHLEADQMLDSHCLLSLSPKVGTLPGKTSHLRWLAINGKGW